MTSSADAAILSCPPQSKWGSAITLGFLGATLMWVAAFFSALQVGFLAGEVIVGWLAIVPVGIGIRAAREGGQGACSGAMAGLVTGVINLLLVGSVVGDSTPSDMVMQGVMWGAGTVMGTVVAGFIGGLIGARMKPLGALENVAGRFARIAAATTFLMLMTGGIVTGFEAGLAVPDWPNSFGHNMLLYPLSEMLSDADSGIFYEHAHRLMGMYIGLIAIVMIAVAAKFDRRKATILISSLILLAVIAQGVIGGERVTNKSLFLAIIHGINGQVVFCLFVWMAAVTSTTWRSAGNAVATLKAKSDHLMTGILLGAMMIQLGLGAAYRHLVTVPEINTTHILYTHIVMSIVVLGLVGHVAVRCAMRHRDRPVLPTLGQWMILVVMLQLALGVGALILVSIVTRDPQSPAATSEVIVTTLHQANGALLLGLAMLSVVWTRRLLCKGQVEVVSHP
jgi:cytochrome c oxidase assembly protein subunit 15